MSERTDVTTEQHRFSDIHFDIITQNEILKEKREQIDANRDGDELKTVWMMESWSATESLKRRESEMLEDREKQQKLDEAIVMLYMKILSYQSQKVDSIKKKLDHLEKSDQRLICPSDYTVQAFQEWTRTNPKIHAMQSEVLDLLAQKIKLRGRLTEEESLRTFSFKDFTGTVEKLHSQAMFYLERDPLVDTEFSLHVSSLADVEANTFEAGKMREFINYCWDNQYAEDLGATYQEFIGALVEHIMTKYGHMRRSGASKSDLTRDQIFAIIEGHLIPHIYDCIKTSCDDDDVIKQRFHEHRLYSQEQMGVNRRYIDKTIQPYRDAILRLKTLNLVKLPTQKLRIIIQSSQLAMQKMTEIITDNHVAGADEFIDVWVFVTLKAAVPNICWNIQYLKDFSNPKYMLSETGYYLSSLEMAAEYIKSLSSDQVDFKEAAATNTSGIKLLLPDVDSVKRMCYNKNTPFELVCDHFELPGYEMVTTLEMVRNTGRLLQIGFAENSNSTALALQIQVSAECSWDMIERYLQKNLYNDLLLTRTNCGTLPQILSTDSTSDTTVFHFTSFDEWSDIINYSNLLYLGGETNICGQHYHASSLKTENVRLTEQIQCQYSLTPHSKKYQAGWSKNLVKEIKERLKTLNLYSTLLPTADGVYSVILEKSIQRFQKSVNDSSNGVIKSVDCKLRQDGICDYQCYSVLKELSSKHEENN